MNAESNYKNTLRTGRPEESRPAATKPLPESNQQHPDVSMSGVATFG
eukprot:IDg21066t1